MKASLLVKMLICMPVEKGASIRTIISNDDSKGRTKVQHIDNVGLLPQNIEEPSFLAHPSYLKRVFARAIYNLADAPVKVSKVSKGLAAHSKNYGACVKWYRHLSATELLEMVYNIIEHICGYHNYCNKSCCYDKKAIRSDVSFKSPVDH